MLVSGDALLYQPLAVCQRSQPGRDPSFDGVIWESEVTWEAAFSEVVDSGQLSPRALAERFNLANPRVAEAPDLAPVATPARGDIPDRDLQATRNQIDLSRYYNASLRDPWHSNMKGNSLAELPAGLQVLDGTTFDVRGIVQISSSQLRTADMTFPHQITGIHVKQKAKRLHFLHATGYLDEEGANLGQYVIHYSSGQQETLPIIYGVTVRDWWFYPDTPKEATGSRLAWTGKNEAASNWNPPLSLRLYKTTWKNPNPDAEIASIDLVSGEKASAPFLIAITAE